MSNLNPRLEQYRKELEKHRQKRKEVIESKQKFEKKKNPQIKKSPNTVVEIKERINETKTRSISQQKIANSPKIGWFTCKGRRDGIGAQTLGIISVMVTAKSLNMEYVYKPFAYIEHCPTSNGKTPTERELKIWVEGFERQLNLNKIDGVAHINIMNKTIKTIDHNNILSILRDGNINGGHILATRETHTFNEHFRNDTSVINAWSDVIQSINKVYGWDRKILPHFITNEQFILNVAIHIRRGDAEKNDRRTIALEYYLKTMKVILRTILLVNDENKQQQKPEYKVNFHIYSQGDLFYFNELNEIEESGFSSIIYHLNVNVNETLHHLANAHILIMAKSTLSYLSALLNPNGIMIYYPFWLTAPKPVEDRWLQYKDTNEDIFIDQLKSKIKTH